MMRQMSRTPLLRLLPAMILAGALCAERSAVAGVILHDFLDQTLVASTAPMPLGPVASSGRTSWNCQPERAAGSAQWQDAGLPTKIGALIFHSVASTSYFAAVAFADNRALGLP